MTIPDEAVQAAENELRSIICEWDRRREFFNVSPSPKNDFMRRQAEGLTARILSAIEVSGNPGQLEPSPRALALEELLKPVVSAFNDVLASYPGDQDKWFEHKQRFFDAIAAIRDQVRVNGQPTEAGRRLEEFLKENEDCFFDSEIQTVKDAIFALSSQPVVDGWLPIETAPKDKTIIGFGRMVGVNLCYHNGKQWNKTELSASFQLSAQAITHWRPLPSSPGASE